MHRGTVANDIEALSAAGVKIKHRRSSQNKYFLAEGEFELSELKILIDAAQSSRFITEEKCRDLVVKLKGLTNVQNARKLKSNIHTSGRARSENEKGYEIVDTINDAINDGRQLSFFYTDIDSEKKIVLRNDGKPYIVSPYTLIWNDDFYYLLGFDHEKEAMRTYRVDRILDRPEILKEKAEPAPEDLDIGRYTREVFSMYDSEEVQEVELLCSYSVMKYIVDQFGRDIKIKRAGKGWFGLTVSVCASPTFYSWVFQFGGNIKIKGPEEVKEEYRRMALKAME
jgi:predicted DNA-binding transcriptional regulator YafY